MSHKWMSRVTHTNESWHTHKRVLSHKRMSHVTDMNESCLTLNPFGWTRSHTYQWGMSHLGMSQICMSHVAYKNESFRTHEWVMSHIWMSHVTHMNESCRTCEWVMSHIWMSHVTHMNESRTWIRHAKRINESHVRKWPALTHQVFSSVNEPCHTYEWVRWHIWKRYVE